MNVSCPNCQHTINVPPTTLNFNRIEPSPGELGQVATDILRSAVAGQVYEVLVCKTHQKTAPMPPRLENEEREDKSLAFGSVKEQFLNEHSSCDVEAGARLVQYLGVRVKTTFASLVGQGSSLEEAVVAGARDIFIIFNRLAEEGKITDGVLSPLFWVEAAQTSACREAFVMVFVGSPYSREELNDAVRALFPSVTVDVFCREGEVPVPWSLL